GHPAVADPPRDRQGAAAAALETRVTATEEARQHPAVSEAPQPLLRVVRGQPTAAELAALVAVVTAARAAAAPPASRPRSPWTDPRCALRRPLEVGAGAWLA